MWSLKGEACPERQCEQEVCNEHVWAHCERSALIKHMSNCLKGLSSSTQQPDAIDPTSCIFKKSDTSGTGKFDLYIHGMCPWRVVEGSVRIGIVQKAEKHQRIDHYEWKTAAYVDDRRGLTGSLTQCSSSDVMWWIKHQRSPPRLAATDHMCNDSKHHH